MAPAGMHADLTQARNAGPGVGSTERICAPGSPMRWPVVSCGVPQRRTPEISNGRSDRDLMMGGHPWVGQRSLSTLEQGARVYCSGGVFCSGWVCCSGARVDGAD